MILRLKRIREFAVTASAVFILVFFFSCSNSPSVKPGKLPGGETKLSAVTIDSSLLPSTDSMITAFGLGHIHLGDSLNRCAVFLKEHYSEEKTSVNGSERFFRHYTDASAHRLFSIEAEPKTKIITGVVVYSAHYATPRGFHVGSVIHELLDQNEIVHPYTEQGELHLTLEHEGITVIPDTSSQRRYFSNPDFKFEDDSLAYITRIEI